MASSFTWDTKNLPFFRSRTKGSTPRRRTGQSITEGLGLSVRTPECTDLKKISLGRRRRLCGDCMMHLRMLAVY